MQHTEVLGDALQAHTQAADRVIEEKARELFGDDFDEKARKTVEKAEAHAKTFGRNLWQWGKDLQTAVLSLREDTPPRRRGNDMWDTALGGVMGAAAPGQQQPRFSGRSQPADFSGYPTAPACAAAPQPATNTNQRAESPDLTQVAAASLAIPTNARTASPLPSPSGDSAL